MGISDLNREWIYRNLGRDPEPGSYGDLKPLSKYDTPEPTDYYEHELLGGSDYSGGTLTRSNYETFLEEFGNVEGVYALTGGHGTYAVAIRLDAITPEMMKVFERLEDYPVLDEDKMSELEHEEEEESWESWAKDEFKKLLVKELAAGVREHFHGTDLLRDVDVDSVTEDFVDSLTDGEVRELFNDAMDATNINWEHGDEGASLRISRVVEGTDWSDEVQTIVTRMAESDPGELPHTVDPNQLPLPGVSERFPPGTEGYFEFRGREFHWAWLNHERTRLSVRTYDPEFDVTGSTDVTDWPSDEEISTIVGKPVRFFDSGDAPDAVEAIFHAKT